jgi:hypothetical protein
MACLHEKNSRFVARGQQRNGQLFENKLILPTGNAMAPPCINPQGSKIVAEGQIQPVSVVSLLQILDSRLM